MVILFARLLGRKANPKAWLQIRPTKRAPDGWWAPRFEPDSSEEFGSVSLVGSPQPPVTQAVRWLGLILNCYPCYDLCIEMAQDYFIRINIALIGKANYLQGD
jgi:hypothetical protein